MAQSIDERGYWDAKVARERRESAAAREIKAKLLYYQQHGEEIFAAEWTRDVTIERRAAWNALARKGTKMLQCQQALEFKAQDLKRAIDMHGL